MNGLKAKYVPMVLPAVMLLLTGACDSAGGNDPTDSLCEVEGRPCEDSAQCEAITPGAVCMEGICTCAP